MKNNAYIIQSKDNNLIQKSSSGGMFAQLAKYVLSQNGIVFGCEMVRTEEGFDVRHIYIENEKDLYKLQGSKYVQSNLGNTIKQAKEFLDNGRLVLFSGTPCQIAGLKAFLKQDYKNLITVDLSCEGTPSLNIFNDYIKYLEKHVIKNKIIDFKFRSKKYFGWSTSGFVAIYKDKNTIKEKVLPQNTSSYFCCFLNGHILQDRCFSCKFTGINRTGDITIADAWGVEKEYPELLKQKFEKNKGVSLILVNSEKGNKIFNIIKNNLIYNNIDIKKLRKYNHPLRHPSIAKSDRELYLSAYKTGGYEKLEDVFKKTLGWKFNYYKIKNKTPKLIKNIIKLFMNKKEKVDCLLYTMFYHSNYGSLLTAYALQKIIENLGYKTRHINIGNVHGYNKPFIKKYLKLTNKIVTLNDFKKLNKLTEVFILGSDNLINLFQNDLSWVARSLLNFTQNNKKRIMISGSIGEWDGKTQNQEEHDYIKYLLNRFDYLSTREKHGKQIFKDVFDCEADWINDPVFYLEKQDFIDLTKDVKMDYSNKIMQYVLYPTEKTQKIIDYYKDNLKNEVVVFEGNEHVKPFSKYKNKTVEHWLSAILNSELIITDSFHCVVFSLIFNKKFVCIKNTHATVRFTSIFKRLGINIPLIETVDDLQNYNFSYDKDIVNKNLNDIRNFAIDKIYEQLLKPKSKHIENKNMEEYNNEFLKQHSPWYKKSKLFYFGIIVPFVIPIKRIIQYKKRNNQ